MTGFILVLTATPSEKDAQHLADLLVGERLASSTNIIGPVKSTYWWKGVKETAREEWFCLIRTRSDLYTQIESTIKAKHVYEEPGIIAIPIIGGSESYLNWIATETLRKQENE